MTPIYRGLTKEVGAANNNAGLIAMQSALNWKACKVPLLMQGRIENRPYTPKASNQRFAIVNCDNASVIDGGMPVGKDFKLVDHKQLLADVCTFANEAGMIVQRAGAIDGGRLIVIEAEFPELKHLNSIQSRQQAGLKVGDAVAGGITIVASHQPGVKTRVRSFLRRLSCLNGMTVAQSLQGLSLSHRQSYDAKMREQLHLLMQQVSLSFDAHIERVNMLTGTMVSRDIQRAHIAQVLQPGLLDAVIEESVRRGVCAQPTSTAAFVIDELAAKDVVRQLLDSYMQDEGKRVVDNVIGILDSQPGVEHCRGTLAQSYHAITHHIDHNYGRKNNPDSAVEFALLGIGDSIKQNALAFGGQLAAAVH